MKNLAHFLRDVRIDREGSGCVFSTLSTHTYIAHRERFFNKILTCTNSEEILPWRGGVN